jgi:hypothetical protein
LVAGSILCVCAIVFFAPGVWGLWVDRMDRSGGFVTIGTTQLNTGTYAFESPMHGDGPRWIYGPSVLGTARVRGSSDTAHPLFIGIARTSDVARYLDRTGHATIAHLATGDVTIHDGGAPTAPPTHAVQWAASTQGSGQQTLVWTPRAGDWSIVLMNADAAPGVALRGDLSAKMPPLPWIAGGLLLVGTLLGSAGAWLLMRGVRGRRRPARSDTSPPSPAPATAPPSSLNREEVNA